MTKNCLNCKKEIDKKSKFHPFCSKRCSNLDLYKWLDNKYIISKDVDVEN